MNLRRKRIWANFFNLIGFGRFAHEGAAEHVIFLGPSHCAASRQMMISGWERKEGGVGGRRKGGACSRKNDLGKRIKGLGGLNVQCWNVLASN